MSIYVFYLRMTSSSTRVTRDTLLFNNNAGNLFLSHSYFLYMTIRYRIEIKIILHCKNILSRNLLTYTTFHIPICERERERDSKLAFYIM